MNPESGQIPVVGDGSGLESDASIHAEELQLATRNHAIPLEALNYDVTPSGMHYTLVHYDIPQIEPSTWSLVIRGALRRPLNLNMRDIQRRETTTQRVTIECAGDGRALLSPRPLSQPWQTGAVGTADWTGTPLAPLLEEAGLESEVVEILFAGVDRGVEGGVEQDYERSLPLHDALAGDAILAWEMNGRPLEPQHGFPLRLVIPGWYGMAHVKWLARITALTEPFNGYQHSVAYRYSDTRLPDSGEPVTLMRVRSLMVPPGIPDFLTRTRLVDRGIVNITGRAWSGRAAIAHVEVSTDAGTSWAEAQVDPSDESQPHAWQGWRFTWNAERPGNFQLVCRATDTQGSVQPLEQFWTARGMGNNMAHRVQVFVR